MKISKHSLRTLSTLGISSNMIRYEMEVKNNRTNLPTNQTKPTYRPMMHTRFATLTCPGHTRPNTMTSPFMDGASHVNMSQSQENQQQVVPLKYSHPKIFSEIDGVIHMPGATREILQTVAKLKTRSTDVIIATWPKSGTTWTMEILWQIFNDAQIINTRVDQKVKFIELLYMPTSSGDQRSTQDVEMAFDSLPSPRLLKTHLPYSLVPRGDNAKVIWVIRNPKDCAVSFYHHYNGLAICECDCAWEEFFEHFMNGKLVGGCWFEYTRQWWKHRNDPNILTIKYEDLKKDSPRTIEKIASFVNKPVTKELLERIVEQTTFKVMQNRPAFDHSWFGKKPGSSYNFIRKGEVGDWMNYFTEEQNRRFEERFEQEMKGTGLTMELFQ